MKKVLAIIPARSGSKGIPNKNKMNILGKPLVYWSFETAKKSKYINKVILSSDDKEIIKIAKNNHIDAPFTRPSQISGDLSLDIDVFKHTLEWLSENEKYYPDFIVHLRPTIPFRNVNIVDQAIQRMIENTQNADSLRSISLASQTPYKMWRVNEDLLEPVIQLDENTESHSLCRQMLPKIYWQNGYVDITRPETIMKKSSMVGEIILKFIINQKMHDLDYVEDIPKVEALLRESLKNENETNVEDSSLEDIERFPV